MREKSTKIIKIFGIVIFFSILVFPSMLFNSPGRNSILENKRTADMPVISRFNIFDRDLPMAIDMFFEDNIGLKEEAILAKVHIMYKIFHQIAIKNYMIGKNQHVYYITDAILNSYQHLDALNNEKKERAAKVFDNLNNEFRNKDCNFVFMPIPNKEGIYNEYMPDNIHVLSPESMMKGMSDYIRQKTPIHVVNTEKALLAAKDSDELLYYKNIDVTHWNNYGSWIGYQALIDEICSINPRIRKITSEDIRINKKTINQPISFLSSAYSSIKNTFADMSDYSYEVSLEGGWKGVCDNIPPGSIPYDELKNYYHYHNSEIQNNECLVILGDSYIYSFMLPLLSESFSDVYFLSYSTDPMIISQVIEYTTPQIVVFEAVSRMVGYESIIGIVSNLYKSIKNSSWVINQYASIEGEYTIHFDDPLMETEKRIILSKYNEDSEIIISGWALDLESNTGSGGVLIQVSNTYYETQDVLRYDLSPDFLESGFNISIPISKLKDVDIIEVFTLTKDHNNIFPPEKIHIIK